MVNINVLMELEKDRKLLDSDWIEVDGSSSVSHRVEEKDRGGLVYSWTYLKENRAYVNSKRINVPWTNKQLSIEYETFRDKLKPGQEEEWTLKISGPKQDPCRCRDGRSYV